jgi:hypothetical protein
MIVVKRVLGLLSVLVFAGSCASAGLVIDPFTTTLPVLAGASNVPTAPTQNVGNADRFLTRSIGGVTTSGNTQLNFSSGTRTASLFYDLRAPVNFTAAGQNYFATSYSATSPAGAGSYSLTFRVLSAFSPGAAVLSQAVVSGLSLAAPSTDILVSSSSFSVPAALANARYLQVSVTRSNNVRSGTFSFTSALRATGTPEPASLVLAAMTAVGAVVAARRRRASRASEVV